MFNHISRSRIISILCLLLTLVISLWIGKNDSEDWSIQLDHSHREYGIDINGAGNYMIRLVAGDSACRLYANDSFHLLRC